MGVRHIDRASTESDLFGSGGDPGKERDAGGDILGLVGDVLADIGLGEPEFVGQQESFTVFPKGKLLILAERMDRHRKETQLHHLLLQGAPFLCEPTVRRS
jgi:hypothetical protein